VRSTNFLFTTLCTSIQVFRDLHGQTGARWNVGARARPRRATPAASASVPHARLPKAALRLPNTPTSRDVSCSAPPYCPVHCPAVCRRSPVRTQADGRPRTAAVMTSIPSAWRQGAALAIKASYAAVSRARTPSCPPWALPPPQPLLIPSAVAWHPLSPSQSCNRSSRPPLFLTPAGSSPEQGV
jgi:hypothetical protein